MGRAVRPGAGPEGESVTLGRPEPCAAPRVWTAKAAKEPQARTAQRGGGGRLAHTASQVPSRPSLPSEPVPGAAGSSLTPPATEARKATSRGSTGVAASRTSLAATLPPASCQSHWVRASPFTVLPGPRACPAHWGRPALQRGARGRELGVGTWGPATRGCGGAGGRWKRWVNVC